jgi:hypothetical protein
MKEISNDCLAVSFAVSQIWELGKVKPYIVPEHEACMKGYSFHSVLRCIDSVFLPYLCCFLLEKMYKMDV